MNRVKERVAVSLAAAAVLTACSGEPGAARRPDVSATESPSPSLVSPPAEPAALAAAYLQAWQDRRYDDLPPLTNDATTDIAGVYRRLDERLQIERIAARPGTYDAATRSLPYTAVLTLRNAGDLALTNRITLTAGPAVRVVFTAATLFPGLQRGERVDRADVVARGRLLDRQGLALRGLSPDLDVNVLGKVEKGKGVNGVERLVDTELTGGTAPAVVVVNATTGETLRQVKRFPATSAPGRDVTTTLDARTQRAASAALATAPGVAALVAVDASTGGVLAVANKPTTGFPPALAGSYAPGSTFKIATALAALSNGLTPDSRVDCPETINAGGKTFRNHEPGSRGSITLRQAFAQSCNTAFINVANDLPKGSITAAAELLGFNAGPPLPIRSSGGAIPPPSDGAEAAADAIGQGRVESSPLTMAAVTAAVANGTWRQPHLTACPRCASRGLPATAVRGLRAMMRAVVTSGTGSALAGVAGQPAAKTGTAEYGSASPPATHAWIVGYRGTLAFAIYIETGPSGGQTAGPVARRFLGGLPIG